MSCVNKSITIPYSAEQIYRLVEHIELYPEVVDWCTKGEIISLDNNIVTAALTFEWNKVHYTFSTKNTMQPYKRIDIQLQSGPFKKLCGHWAFNPLNKHWSEIVLNLEFEFDMPGLNLIFNPIFTSMANHWVDSFCHRAEELYD